ncbi:hypothetical protein FRACYDRAFT_245040 [Fragilariopsis cylindrus CCMP1102]|uniref:Uncharacterized protein n=1 Tax=Fragilariopsis cylindrus CCMP1102 TaxID=635003 RepID=A0A1E7F1B8_9STRA|nr:hypothetical protein FRACYDRAFT_245040 [Fragilariopsis cylindrus CCMP1102]|eukprot:OEU11917.1 hypothetical protein FRACYDRAFT_245040 [Fragilariopsis cylindrus CCMP1102]
MSSDDQKRRRLVAKQKRDNNNYNAEQEQQYDFLDSTSTVAVSTFSSRRLPEIKKLYYDNNSNNNSSNVNNVIINESNNSLLSGGGKVSSRHLRRRTTAHSKSKRHYHRYPRGGIGQDQRQDQQQDQDQEQQSKLGGTSTITITRKSRRKKQSILCNERHSWLLDGNDNDDDAAGDVEVKVKQKWLLTHLWHVKRFHTLSLSNFGGWTGIPLIHTNRGSRAAIRLSQDCQISSSSVLIRDITWEVAQPIIFYATTITKKQEQQQQHLSTISSMMNIQHYLGRKICPDLLLVGKDKEEAITSKMFCNGSLSIEGIMYGVDTFPHNAIGPISSRRLPLPLLPIIDDNDNTNNNTQTIPIEIRCHPSIHNEVIQTMNELILQKTNSSTAVDNDKNSPPSLQLSWKKMKMDSNSNSSAIKDVNNNNNNPSLSIPIPSIPKICFRLYGIASTDILIQILLLCSNNGSNGSSNSTTSIRSSSLSKVDDHNSNNGRNNNDRNCNSLMLIYRSPRLLDCSANRAISGWEIYCYDPKFAKELWFTLVTYDNHKNAINNHNRDNHENIHQQEHKQQQQPQKQQRSSNNNNPNIRSIRIRGCCAIGLIEETTTISSSSSSNTSKSADANDDEDEDGVAPPSPNTIDEEEIGFSTTDCNIVTVRGSFGQPFINVVEGCCGRYDNNINILSKKSTQTTTRQRQRQRRHRRKVHPPNNVIVTPPMSRNDKISLNGMCQQLHNSLSLPAILLVHIRLLDKGTLQPGMQIIAATATATATATVSPFLLGTITAGSFSVSRGICHGIGVIGASRLLQYVTQVTRTTDINNNDDGNKKRKRITNNSSKMTASYGRVVRLANGSQSLQLLVRVVAKKKKKNQQQQQHYSDERSTGESVDDNDDETSYDYENNVYSYNEACISLLT